MTSSDSSVKQLFTNGYLLMAIESVFINNGRKVCLTFEAELLLWKDSFSSTSALQFISSTKWKCGTFAAIVIDLTIVRWNPLKEQDISKLHAYFNSFWLRSLTMISYKFQPWIILINERRCFKFIFAYYVYYLRVTVLSSYLHPALADACE